VVEVAKETGHTPAQVALAWTLLEPAVTSTILGARTLEQLEDNLGALEVTLSDDQRARLDAASAVDLGFPHRFLQSAMPRNVIYGGTTILPRP
jgi:aryl-alcohol dehydrogenase-like predicted oxidoreductase